MSDPRPEDQEPQEEQGAHDFAVEEGELRVFSETPDIRVTDARIDEGWTRKHVEYAVEIEYLGFTRKVQIPRSSIESLWSFVKRNYKTFHDESEEDFPSLSGIFASKASDATSDESKELVQEYLRKVAATPEVLNTAFVAALFQVSHKTFHQEDGITSIREGFLKVSMRLKEDEDEELQAKSLWNKFTSTFTGSSAKQCWVVLHHSCIVIYENITDKHPLDVFLFDKAFNIHSDSSTMGYRAALSLSNTSFIVEMEAKTKQSIAKWNNAIIEAANKSEWTLDHTDDSFAITRTPTDVPSYARWFVDGSGTYEAMFDEISKAKDQVFIAGWWVCPTIYLKRPFHKYPESRLDQLLQNKAAEGVQVYVLMYKEVDMALTLNSEFSKNVLSRLHKNMHVLRDPDFILEQLGMYSHHEKIVVCDQKVAFVGGLDICFGRWDTGDHQLYDEEGEDSMFPGKDFSNPRIKDFVEVNQPNKDLMDRDTCPRMPWHDCHSRVEGQPARDVARHFVQRWNYAVSTRELKEDQYHLIPRTDYTTLKRLHEEEGVELEDVDVETEGYSMEDDSMAVARGVPCQTQIHRSCTWWSAGTPTEQSIQNAYIRLISEAKHFVYIENQFFISGLEGDDGTQNRIAEAIVERIKRAAANDEQFRVMVMMPLMPGFEGMPGEKGAFSLRGVMYWQYRTICRGEGSIYSRLFQELEDDPFKYIAFYGLRKYDIRHGKPETEEIYIHNKTMIVDDQHVIVGSANINERSQNGDRDSEIAVVIDDHEMADASIADGEGQVGKFGHSFRMRLFAEHFGIEPGTERYEMYTDPVNLECWLTLQDHAMRNTWVYENVFTCQPTDSVRSFEQLGAEHTDSENKATAPDTLGPGGQEGGFASRLAESDQLGGVKSPQRQKSQRQHSEDEREEKTKKMEDQNNSMMGYLRSDEEILESKDELEKIMGHAVYFPLKYLDDEDLCPPSYYPDALFQ